MVRDNEDGPMIAGVPNGTGRIDIPAILDFLIDKTELERICVECSHGHCSNVLCHPERIEATTGPTFEIVEPPYDPAALFALEHAAVARSVARTRLVLHQLGFSLVLNGRGGVYQRSATELAFADRHL
ncbi:MAG: hypothetical protein GDA49_13865 [Rhodospirillales bacterium]|nr:hypothetical protein [Rhodospirillales bacterium]